MDAEGRKRCLPPWMLGAAGPQQSSNSGNIDETNNLGIGLVQPVKETAVNKEKKEAALNKEHLEANSCLFTKSKRNRRKRKSCQQDADCDVPEAGLKKKKHDGPRRAVCISPTQKRQKEESSWSSSGKESNQSLSDDDGELTMEDLMSIAKEYVKADKDVEQQQSSNREPELQSQLEATVSPSNELGGSVNDPESNQILPTHETEITESLTSEEEIVSNNGRTGHPAQDMLDLLFGSLLKKPSERRKKIESVTNDMAFSCDLSMGQNDDVEELPTLTKKKKIESVTNDVAFSSDLGVQGQNDMVEELIPIVKKKSSLKETS